MSLVNPNMLEKVMTLIVTYKKIIVGLSLALILIFVALLIADKISTWKGNRDVNRLRTNVNLASQELRQAQDNLVKDHVAEAVAVEKVAEASNALLTAKNASEAVKSQTNAQLEELRQTVANKQRADVIAQDLEKRLNEIEPR